MNNKSKRLHLNEMQVPLPDYLFEGIDFDAIRFYPLESLEEELRRLISSYVGVTEDEVFIYSGIDGLIELMYKALHDSAFVVPKPSYYVYEQEALRQGVHLNTIELSHDYRLTESFFKQSEGAVCVVVNPNNPTGNILLQQNEAERLLLNAQYLVVDEAYYEFSHVTMAPLVKEWDNLIVFRTFSKAFGLAGARISYMVSNQRTIERFSRYCEIYRVPTLSLMLAKNALLNPEYMYSYVDMVKTEMSHLLDVLTTLDIRARGSDGNFILVDRDFGECLVANGFNVRLMENDARVTVTAPP